MRGKGPRSLVSWGANEQEEKQVAMPKSAQYIIRWSSDLDKYFFIEADNGAYHPLAEEREDWLKWIGEHRAFAFHGRNGHLNLLKEKRSGTEAEGYWYAYQRRKRRMVKRYVGRSDQL